ncbi:hypothetical protein AAZX31_20G062000 [Glycine max]
MRGCIEQGERQRKTKIKKSKSHNLIGYSHPFP